MKKKVKHFIKKLMIKYLKDVNWSNWIASIATVAICILAIFQYKVAKEQAEIQKILANIDLVPSIELDYQYETSSLFIKNTGRTQLYYHVGNVSTYGDRPDMPTKKPNGKRIIAINSMFPLKFDVEVNREKFKNGEPNEFNLYGQFIISNLNNDIYNVKYVVKVGLTFTELDNNPVVNYQGAWVEEMIELDQFPWVIE